MRRIKLFLKCSWDCIVICWKLSKHTGIHYHLVGFNDQRTYSIIWSHLYEAELKYKKELDKLARERLKEFQKMIDREGVKYYPESEVSKVAKKKKKGGKK